MAPKSSKASVPIEKQVWKWAETADPANVVMDHVMTAYRLNLCQCTHVNNKRNCRGNPRCLFGMGERAWFDRKEDDNSDNGTDPDQEKRQKGEYCGLKNLGATCYVNTLLQVWYHHAQLRTAIYRCKSEPQDINLVGEYNPESICGQLQLIFALLENSTRKYIDPSSFINCLGLNTAQQQDAQEFCKLFMTRLEKELSRQDDVRVRNIIKEQFSGQYNYTTRCCVCDHVSVNFSEFYELDLNIRANNDLHACLNEFVKEERLEEENQYMCTHCNTKQNATRRINLTRLPPVLNIQLLRFVFDRKSNRKKKLNSSVQFPEELDMRPYMSCDTSYDRYGRQDTFLYTLTAVLIHRGTTANSGHYIAHIRHDNTPTPTPTHNATSSNHHSDARTRLYNNNTACTSSRRRSSSPRKCSADDGRPETAGSEISYTAEGVCWYKYNDECVERMSGDRLQLGTEEDLTDSPSRGDNDNAEPSPKKLRSTKSVHGSKNAYMLVYSRHDVEPPIDNGALIPAHVQLAVMADNDKFDTWCQRQKLLKEKKASSGRARRRYVCDLYRRLAVPYGTTEHAEFLSADWLSRWLVDAKLSAPVDNEQFLCEHGRLNVDKISQVKLVASEAASELYETYRGGPRIPCGSLCRTCVQERCRAIKYRMRLNADHQLVTQVLKHSTNHTSDDVGFWVSKLSIKSWKSLALQQEAGQDEGERDSRDDVTETCADVSESDDDSGETNKRRSFNADILCEEHKELNVDVNGRRVVSPLIWNIFKFHFPNAPEVPTSQPMCEPCQFQTAIEAHELDQNRFLAAQFREQLSDLYAGRKRPIYDVIVGPDVVRVINVIAITKDADDVTAHRNGDAVISTIVCNGDEVWYNDISDQTRRQTQTRRVNGTDTIGCYYVVSNHFLDNWRKFIRLRGRHELPVDISCDVFLCAHGQLRMPLEKLVSTDSDRYPRASLLYAGEWEILRTALGGLGGRGGRVAEVRLIRRDTQNVSYYSVDHDVCRKCSLARDEIAVAEFSNAHVYIHRLHADTEPDKCTDQLKATSFPTNSSACNNEDAPIRRSHRHRKSRDDLVIRISSNDTLRDLKLKLMGKIPAAPYDQHLWLDGLELTEEMATVATLGLTPYCVLNLKVDEPLDQNNAYSEADVEALSSCSEEGFKGTCLQGVH